MPTINQLVKRGRTRQSRQGQGARAAALAAEAWRVHARLHDDAEEAELGAAEGRARAADQRHRGHRVHSRVSATICRSTRSCSSGAAA